MLGVKELSKLLQLNPFEVKSTLIAQAQSDADRMMLNAGRGNPNRIATLPRHAFWEPGPFTTVEAQRFRSPQEAEEEVMPRIERKSSR